MLVRADSGALYPSHRHASTEEMFMIQGDLSIGAQEYGVGDYIRSESGTIHPAGRTANGCMFLIRTSIDDETLPVMTDAEADGATAP
jgi:anti-sigma factor ChrR (cupin superfamily)